MRKFRRTRQVGGVKPTEMYFKAMNWIHQRVCRSNHWRKRLANKLLPWALDGLDLGRNVLEVGPGPGLTTDILRRRLERLTCLEIDPVLAQSLRERMRGSNVTVVQGDATAMPFPDETYSGAVSFTMSSMRWVEYYAAAYRVPVELVEAIIDEESGWNPYAISSKGAAGIMQLMPGTAIRFGIHNRFRVNENVRGGVAYLAWLIQRFGADLRLVTAAYYVGEGPVSARGLAYSSLDVQGYVKRVARRYRSRRLLGMTTPGAIQFYSSVGSELTTTKNLRSRYHLFEPAENLNRLSPVQLPIPCQEEYQFLGPVGQKMGRILMYIVYKHTRDGLAWNDYVAAHELMTDCWRAVNADPEFCEQMELDLPTVGYPL